MQSRDEKWDRPNTLKGVVLKAALAFVDLGDCPGGVGLHGGHDRAMFRVETDLEFLL